MASVTMRKIKGLFLSLALAVLFTPPEIYSDEILARHHARAAYDPWARVIIMPEFCQGNTNFYCEDLRKHEKTHFHMTEQGIPAEQQHALMAKQGIPVYGRE